MRLMSKDARQTGPPRLGSNLPKHGVEELELACEIRDYLKTQCVDKEPRPTASRLAHAGWL